MSPSDRKSLHPLVIPLSRRPGARELTGLLRWPTPPDKLGLQVVRAGKHGLTLLGMSTSQYITRLLVEEDAGAASARPIAEAAGPEGDALYARGAFAAAGGGRLEVYLTKRVGKVRESRIRPLALAAQLQGYDGWPGPRIC